jgi:hypothetical protein
MAGTPHAEDQRYAGFGVILCMPFKRTRRAWLTILVVYHHSAAAPRELRINQAERWDFNH